MPSEGEENLLHVPAGTLELAVQYLHLTPQSRFSLGLLFTRSEPFLLFPTEGDEFGPGGVELRGEQGQFFFLLCVPSVIDCPSGQGVLEDRLTTECFTQILIDRPGTHPRTGTFGAGAGASLGTTLGFLELQTQIRSSPTPFLQLVPLRFHLGQTTFQTRQFGACLTFDL